MLDPYSLTQTSSATYNQALLQQNRLDELIMRIDRLFMNLFRFYDGINTYGYWIAFNDLSSIFATVSAKLKNEDEKAILKLRTEIREYLRLHNPFIVSYDFNSKSKLVEPNFEVQDNIIDKLLSLRILIEKYMDKYGLGNPSKRSPSTAVIQ